MTEQVEFNVIVANARRAPPTADRGGGEQHGAVAAAGELVARTVKTTADKLAEQMGGTISALTKALADAAADYKIDEVTLSLAVTAEGDIGIVTAGIEGSIEIKLKPKA